MGRPTLAGVLDRARQTGTPFGETIRVVRRDTGEIRHVLVQGGRVDPAGVRREMYGTSVDVTEQHEAIERIRFQARLLKSIGEAVIATGPDGRVHYWNAAATRLHGWTEEEMRGQPITRITLAADNTAENGRVLARLARGEPWSGEFTARTRSTAEP